MIRVVPAEEPNHFKTVVRQRGVRAVARLLGQKVPGSGRHPKKTYARIEDIPPKKFPPEWRKSLDDLMAAYQQVCAYTGLYIADGTGDATVDHFIPIATDRRQAYEWSNYRLACGQVNAAKGTVLTLDPFTIEDGWFELELVGYQVLPGACTTDPLRALIRTNIEKILDLNNARFRRQRGQVAESYLHGEVSLRHLERHAPFVARELRRQGKIRLADQEPQG